MANLLFTTTIECKIHRNCLPVLPRIDKYCQKLTGIEKNWQNRQVWPVLTRIDIWQLLTGLTRINKYALTKIDKFDKNNKFWQILTIIEKYCQKLTSIDQNWQKLTNLTSIDNYWQV